MQLTSSPRRLAFTVLRLGNRICTHIKNEHHTYSEEPSK